MGLPAIPFAVDGRYVVTRDTYDWLCRDHGAERIAQNYIIDEEAMKLGPIVPGSHTPYKTLEERQRLVAEFLNGS
jgi:hypothetical protein